MFLLTGAALAISLFSLIQSEKTRNENRALRKALEALRKKKTKKEDKDKVKEENRVALKRKETLEDRSSLEGLVVKRIGTVHSIYRLCVGTPRQGLLAPNARGCIELMKLGDSSIASSVSGLEDYSHIWVIFLFHLNTQSSRNSKRIKSKIAPPALGGKKVGIFSTRTPHRFNPIGITLCKLDRIETIKQKVFLHVSGLDLVDGTPVLDIKPYVPVYDSVQGDVKLPSWVAGGLATKRDVKITEEAQMELVNILAQNPKALQFYGGKHTEKSVEDTIENVLECIRQVLSIDVRSKYQTKKARKGKFQAERSERLQNANAVCDSADICTQQLDNLLIQYVIIEAADLKRISSENSGAEDSVSVLSIQHLTKKDAK